MEEANEYYGAMKALAVAADEAREHVFREYYQDQGRRAAEHAPKTDTELENEMVKDSEKHLLDDSPAKSRIILFIILCIVY